MDKQQIAVMIPIIVSLGAFLMVFGLRYLQNKENMSMIERGINPSESKRRFEADPSRTLKNGMMFVGAGIGLLLAILITSSAHNMSEDSKTGLFFALIAIFGGAGMLGAYFYERKNPPTE